MEYNNLFNLYYQDKEKYLNTFFNRFNSEITYKFDLDINGNQAFLFLHTEHYKLISEIQSLDKELLTLISPLNLPGLALTQYIKEMLVSEIKNTNDIEGVVSTRREIEDILEQLNSKKHDRLYGMVNRYNFLLTKKDINIKTANDIRKIYDDLVSKEIIQNDPGDVLDGTIFRTKTVYFKSASGKILHEGLNPESEIISILSESLNILYDENINVLVRLSVFHYLFGYVHPFYNGNGRVNRFISSYLLSQNFTHIIGFRLSQQIKEQKGLYYKAFEKTNDPKNKADLGTFTYYFLKILKNLFKSTTKQIASKKNKLDYYEEKLVKCNLDKNQKSVIYLLIQASLFSENGVSLKEISEGLGKSSSTVRNIISKFKSKNLVEILQVGHKVLYKADLNVFEQIECNE